MIACALQTANKESGANCKNLSLHRGKAAIKQRFQTGSVDEVCFLGATSSALMHDHPSSIAVCLSHCLCQYYLYSICEICVYSDMLGMSTPVCALVLLG